MGLSLALHSEFVGSHITVWLLGASCSPTHLLPSNPHSLQIIKKLIERKQAQIRKVYPGLTCFKEGVRQIPIESVPGIRESWQGVRQKGSVLPLHGCSADMVTLTLVFQEKQDGNHWGRRRGECCMGVGVGLQHQGWGLSLGCASVLAFSWPWNAERLMGTGFVLQEGVEGPRPALQHAEEPPGPDQGVGRKGPSGLVCLTTLRAASLGMGCTGLCPWGLLG